MRTINQFNAITNLKSRIKILIVFIIQINTLNCFAQPDTSKTIYHLSIKELSEMKVITSSIVEEEINYAPSNITVITKKMIQERGYQTLVDICQDIPGFDFMVYNDGGGEYPTFNMNRGVGTIGNPEILIMIDGIIQNNISFNWSLLWTYENLLIDIERIEIIEGPGSSIYGAQAYTGVINFITRSGFSGVEVNSFYGSNFTKGTNIYTGKQFNKNINFSIAFHNYNTGGDNGNRYDPGGYFHGLQFPDTILHDYDLNGNYVTNTINPKGGKNIPEGFQNWADSYSVRAKLQIKNSETGAFYWENNMGGGSAIAPYEYNITHADHRSKTQGYHIYVKNNYNLTTKFLLQSNITYRATNILPKTGFRYNYRFSDMTKNYVSYAYQAYIEERLIYSINENNNFLFGLKGTYSNKSDRIVSLNYFPDSKTSTQSSWDAASTGEGLNITQEYPRFKVSELALFGLWNNHWTKKLYSSIGLRYDYNSEYGNILNPRTAITYRPINSIWLKLLYGSAFREPSIFELHSEFRGNPDLNPEKINTYELEINSLMFNDVVSLKANAFYLEMKDFIGKVPDTTMPSGERYENTDKMYVSGLSVYANYQPINNLYFYSNYMFMLGKMSADSSWEQIERTAKHKINAGINIHLLQNKLTVDCRMNYVGKRKAQSTNTWLQTYENGYAPSYTKFNLAVSYNFLQHFTARLVINNVLDEQYYGIGRETGSGMVDDYNYITNINPEGHIPAYHPQSGRTYLISLIYKI